MVEAVQASLSLTRRANPANHAQTMEHLSTLLTLPQFNELKHRAYPVILLHTDPETQEQIVSSAFNFFEGHYRSPISGKFPANLDDAPLPSSILRNLEVLTNERFKVYLKSYYGEEAVGSVYFLDNQDKGYQACFTIHKEATNKKGNKRCNLQAIHTIELGVEANDKRTYRISTQLALTFWYNYDLELSGSFSTTTEEKNPYTEPGKDSETNLLLRLVEDSEGKVRRQLENFCQSKAKQVLGLIYTDVSVEKKRSYREAHQTLISQLLEHAGIHPGS